MDTGELSTAHLSRSLLTVDSGQLDSAIGNPPANSAIVVLAGPAIPENRLPIEEIRAAFANSADLAVLLIESVRTESLPSVSPFLPFVPDLSAIAFRRSAPLGRFPDISEPLRERLIQAVENRLRFDRLTIPEDDSSPGGDRLPLLRPAEPGGERRWLRDRIERLDLQTLLPQVRSAVDATAFRAGLLQMNDFLAASHEQSQSIEGAGRNSAGDYWHAMMHRREPDYSNAKYWFRRVGSQAIFPDLTVRSESLLREFPEVSGGWRDRLLPGGHWDPFAFVDLCQACPKPETDELSRFARRLQWTEMQLLLEQTRQDAIGCR
jgi:hypothetical protein